MVKRLIRQAQLETDSPPLNGSAGSGASFVSPSSENANNMSPSKTDPTPERPVFGAYPMPSASALPPAALGMGEGTPAHALYQGQLGVPNQAQGSFNFNVDSNNANSGPFANLASSSFQQGSQLDPAVESMLASYFPPPQTSNTQSELGPAGASQVPDDFLSRVFSFSWDTNNQNSQNQNQAQGQSSSQQQTPLSTPTSATAPMSLGNGAAPGMQPQPRRQDSIPGYGAFDWQTHSWMA